MPYYVLGHGGAKYGPVELGTLNAWAQEGRIVPDTLIEDAGSGVKTPARAVPGLVLRAPSSPAAPAPATPLAPVVPQSNYLRPGQGTGGSSQNLFLPPQDQSSFHPPNIRSNNLFLPTGATPHLQPSRSLFLPNVNSNWGWHSAACVVGSLACGAVVGLMHWYIGRLLIFALALPIYGIQRAYVGAGVNRALAGLLVVLNLLAFGGAILFIFRDALL